MRGVLSLLAAAVAAVCILASPAFARGNFQSGNWEGEAFFENGDFTHCAMSAEYRGGDVLYFAVNGDGELTIGFSNPTLNLRRGASAEMRIQIDNYRAVVRTVQVVNPQLIATIFTDQVDGFQQLRRGQTLYISIGNAQSSYSLQGTYNALVRLLQCAADYS